MTSEFPTEVERMLVAKTASELREILAKVNGECSRLERNIIRLLNKESQQTALIEFLQYENGRLQRKIDWYRSRVATILPRKRQKVQRINAAKPRP